MDNFRVVNTQYQFIDETIDPITGAIIDNKFVNVTGDGINITDNTYTNTFGFKCISDLDNKALVFNEIIDNGSQNNQTAIYGERRLEFSSWWPNTGATPVQQSGIVATDQLVQVQQFSNTGVVTGQSRLVGTANDATTDSYSFLNPDAVSFHNTGGLQARYGKTGILGGWNGIPFNISTNGGMNLQNTAPTTGQVITANSSGNPVWTSNLTNIDSITAITASELNLNGQVTFDTPPHIPDPILGNDAASKGYVDTLIGNYSGNGLSLYLNYDTTQTDPIIAPSTGVLGQTLTPILSPTLNNYYTMRSVALGTDTLISTFTTAVGFPNTLSIPAGLWSLLIWGYSTGTGGQLYYHFHLDEVTSAGVFVAAIGVSGFSSDVNAVSSSDPDAYHASLAIVDGYTMASVTNRLRVQVYTTGTGAVPTYLYSLFGGDYYSNITTTLNGNTSLLSQNNTWTGVNTFSAGFNTTAVDSVTTLSLGTGTATTTSVGRTATSTITNVKGTTINLGDATTTLNVAGATCNFNGTSNVFTDITASYIDNPTTLNIGRTTATDINIGQSGTTTTADIEASTIKLVGAVKSNNIDTDAVGTLNIGNATTNLLALGRAGLASITATATNMTLTGAVGGITSLSTSGVATLNSVSSASYNSTTTSTACDILNTNTAIVNILGATRTATTNMLAGTGANTFNLGSGTTGLSFVVGGLASTFNSATTSISTLRATTIDSVTSSALNIGSNVLTTGINFNNKVLSNIALGSNQYITPYALNTSLPTSGQIGYTLAYTVTSNTCSTVAGTAKDLATYTSVPPGTWLFTTSFNINSGGVDQSTFSLSTASITDNLWNVGGFNTKAVAGNYAQITGVITVVSGSGSNTVYFIGTATTASLSITNIRTRATRIA